MNTVFLSHFCPHRSEGLDLSLCCKKESQARRGRRMAVPEVVHTHSLELCSQGLGDGNLAGTPRTEQAR